MNYDPFNLKTGTSVSSKTPPIIIRSANRESDWVEDFAGENGNYMNTCKYCGNQFIGHKLRRVCLICAIDKGFVPACEQNK